MTIVTEWFRTPAVWRALTDYLRPGPVPVWSGACGPGQEAYSAAMVLLDLHGSADVLATDRDADLLAVAEAGRYAAADIDLDVREDRLPARYRTRFLTRDWTVYRVVDELRAAVAFRRVDLSDGEVPECQVALLRNVWRHLGPDAQERLAASLHATLPPDGRVVLGGGDLMDRHHEDYRPVGLFERFEPAEHAMVWRPR